MDADEARLAQVQADLVAWGMLEPERPGELTRRARAAIARAASVLQEQEKAGSVPVGHPMLVAAGLAVTQMAPPGAALPDHARFLAAVEWASLPEAIQRQIMGQ